MCGGYPATWVGGAPSCPPTCRLSVRSQLLDSDQELYRNFPLTISERWQQEVTETVFDAVNAETDKLEARKKAKNKQLGHEEGEWGEPPPHGAPCWEMPTMAGPHSPR